ncbi:MAG TPA: hypothetical protein VLJ18_09450 [Thermoanaerobaculia bacterium]|nr:hypothetical protein [Thermoanaerobaculia bacterium]
MTGKDALLALESLRAKTGGAAAAEKRACLAVLARRSLRGARAVERLHEALCFLRAYPDDERILADVAAMLARFSRRPDLRRHRRALESSGIAGTAIRFSFYAGTARWLAARWGNRLTVDWKAFVNREALERVFPLIALFAETPGLDELDLGVRGWVKRLKGPRETDASFLVRRLATLGRDAFENEWAYEGLDLPLVLAPGKGGPSRTRAAIGVPAVSFQTAPLDSGRPDVAREVASPPLRVVAATGDEAGRLLDLARESMVTRQRDLDVFQWGDRRDVRLAHFPDGLTFVVIGAVPERRLLLESVYGFLTLKNGVPVGYVLVSALFESSEIAYNVFETFRGGESGRIYGKVLALSRHLFGPDVFTIFPYQLGGYGNPEALDSGAWWFYQKLGFRPRAPHVAKLMEEELARMKADPRHRSTRATLKVLASENLYFHLGKERDDAIGLLELPNVGLRVTDMLARRFGSDRERAEAVLNLEARDLLGLRSLSGWSQGERLAFRRWAPLVAILPHLARWSLAEKRALAAVVRAKGGRRESDFVRLFDRHRKLRRAIAALAKAEPA